MRAAELTAGPATGQTLTEEEFRAMAAEMREVIRTGKAPGGMRLDRWMDHYRDLFGQSFPEGEELFEAVFDECISLEELTAMAFPNRREKAPAIDQ